MGSVSPPLFRIILAALVRDREEAARILGIDPTATRDEVRQAYRRAVMQFHPDRHTLASPEKQEEAELQLKKINLAREIMEGPPEWHPVDPPTSEVRDEDFWNKRYEYFYQRFGPKPTGSYTKADLRDFVGRAFAANFLQFVDRHPIQYWPLDQAKVGGHYYRPVGPKKSTKRQKPENVGMAIQIFQAQPGEILDIVFPDPSSSGWRAKEAWVTWELPNHRGYHSAGFEVVKAPAPKKAPGVGMSRAQVESYFVEKGLASVAGGTKYSYFSTPGAPKKGGFYIRTGAGNMAIVKRDGDIGDIKISMEIYYGKVTQEILDTMIRIVIKRMSAA